jgi:transcriptional regulator with XRE-family HTH domain
MVGKALRLIRVFHDMRPIDLAKKLGVSRSHLCEIERGKKEPSFDFVKRYASTFDLPMSTIIFFAEELRDRKNAKQRFKGSVNEKIVTFMSMVERFDERSQQAP